MNNAPESKQPETPPSNVSLELQDLASKVAALETAVAALSAERNHSGKNIDKPCGRFAHLGGIERVPAHEFEKREKPFDFSDLGGKRVR